MSEKQNTLDEKKVEDFYQLASRAEDGDETALPELRKFLKNPRALEILVVDMASRTQKVLIEKFSGKNLLTRELTLQSCEKLRGELGGPDPTPLERLLVDQVVTCWVYVYYLQMLSGCQKNMSLKMEKHYEVCITLAQRRYLAAIRTLAQVRKLAVPVLQVNIGESQVNVAGSGITAEGDSSLA